MKLVARSSVSESTHLIFQRRTILFLSILLSGGNLLISREILTILILLITVIYYNVISTKFCRSIIPIIIWYTLVLLLSFFHLQEVDAAQYFIRSANFVIGLILIHIYMKLSGDVILSDLLALIMPMSYQAIITFILAFLFPSLFISVNMKGMNIQSFLLVFNFTTTFYSSNIIRPIGFFWEPGVFQIYLNILLFILFVKHAPLRKIVLVVIAVITTYSTTGILITIAQIIYFTIVSLFSRGEIFRKLIVLTTLLVTAPILYSTAMDNLEEKLIGASASSSIARQYDLQSGALVILQHPLLGIGFNPAAYVKYSKEFNPYISGLSTSDQKNGRFNTNGLLVVLYSTGIPLGLVYIVALLFQRILPHKLAFGSLLLLCLSTEPLSLAPFFVMFAFSGMRLPQKGPSG